MSLKVYKGLLKALGSKILKGPSIAKDPLSILGLLVSADLVRCISLVLGADVTNLLAVRLLLPLQPLPYSCIARYCYISN